MVQWPLLRPLVANSLASVEKVILHTWHENRLDKKVSISNIITSNDAMS